MRHSQEVIARFETLGFRYALYHHAPVRTAAERLALGIDFSGVVICKNLFLTTRNESLFLLYMLPAETKADLRALARHLGTSRLCFASDDRLMQLLGLESGCVGVSGLLKDAEHRVSVVFAASLKNAPKVAMHPGDNAMTAVLSLDDLLLFVGSCGAQVGYF